MKKLSGDKDPSPGEEEEEEEEEEEVEGAERPVYMETSDKSKDKGQGEHTMSYLSKALIWDQTSPLTTHP